MDEEQMIVEMKKLFDKGYTNPSAITSILYGKGFEGRFTEIRKLAEYQFKLYSQAEAEKKRNK